MSVDRITLQGGIIVAKEVNSIVKLQIPPVKPTPAPQLDLHLDKRGVNQDFCSQFNDRTKSKWGTLFPL